MAKDDYIIAPYGRADCPVCGGEFSLTKAGVLRHHDDKRSRTNLPFHPRCAGAGKSPSAVPVPQVPAVPEPKLPIGERRRRLEADIKDARETLNRTQQHFDKLCDELGALAREERQAEAVTAYRCTLDGARYPMAVAHLLPGDVMIAECPQGTLTMEADPLGDFGWVTVYCDDPGPRTGRYFNALRLAQNTLLRKRRVITLATRALRGGGAAVIEYGDLQTYPERTEPGPVAFELAEIHESKEA